MVIASIDDTNENVLRLLFFFLKRDSMGAMSLKIVVICKLLQKACIYKHLCRPEWAKAASACVAEVLLFLHLNL